MPVPPVQPTSNGGEEARGRPVLPPRTRGALGPKSTTERPAQGGMIVRGWRLGAWPVQSHVCDCVHLFPRKNDATALRYAREKCVLGVWELPAWRAALVTEYHSRGRLGGES